MTRKCSVNTCKSSKEKSETPLFKVPVNSYATWNEIIAKVNGNNKRKVQFVCAKHFTENDLITSYASLPKDVENLVGKRDRYGLKKGAVPSLFEPSVVVASDNKNFPSAFSKCSHTVNTIKLPERPLFLEPLNKEQCTVLPLQEILESLKQILFPIGWMLYSDRSTMLLYKPVKTTMGCILMTIEKQIVFKFDTLHIDYYVNQKCRSPDILGLKPLTYPLNVAEITNVVRVFECLKICAGGPSIIDYPGILVKKTHLENTIWRHDECPLVSYSKKRCKKCTSLIQYFPVCKKRSLLNKNTPNGKQNKNTKKQKLSEDTQITETLPFL